MWRAFQSLVMGRGGFLVIGPDSSSSSDRGELRRHHQGRDPYRGSPAPASPSPTPLRGKQMRRRRSVRRGLINEKKDSPRGRELLREEGFYLGSMDVSPPSKFVRGDAIAALIITAINIVGGIAIALFAPRRFDCGIGRRSSSNFRSGDGLVYLSHPGRSMYRWRPVCWSPREARAARPTRRFSASWAATARPSSSQRLLLFVLALMPALPALPFSLPGGAMATVAYLIPLAPVGGKPEERLRPSRPEEESARKEEEEKNSPEELARHGGDRASHRAKKQPFDRGS